MQKQEMSVVSWLFNPFERIAGAQALWIGGLIAVAMSALALPVKAHFPGVIDYKLGVALPFVRLLLQNAIAVMDLALCFYLGGLLAKRKRLRLIDFLGTLAVARLPYLLITAGFALFAALGHFQLDLDAIQSGNFSTAFNISILVTVLALIWLLVLDFSALRVSSGLKGGRLWAVFIVGIIGAEALAVMLALQLAV